MGKKLTIEFVRGEFEKEGYELLTETYKNNRHKLNYICPKEHKYFIRWGSWQQGRRCFYCSSKTKHTVAFVKKEFNKEGYRLLSKKYINSQRKLKYICPNGHKHSITWAMWQQGNRCFYCFGKAKHTIDFIRKNFEKEGYILLSDKYINNTQKLNYICVNGHKGTVTWHNWNDNNARCFTCAIVNKSGVNSFHWKGGISCEPYCDAWADKEYKESIKERDGYKCLNPDCYSKNPNDLTIHHIDYNKKSCNPSNLITLCRSCNSRANKDRKWHKAWYQAIMYRRYTI